MNLILEIEFLTGAYRGTAEPASDDPDWPPQPDRLFSALVAAWGAHGEPPAEREALEWLERQEPPVIHAAPASARTAPVVFVPPNDAKRSRTIKTYLRVLPDHRARQPRRFPAARPEFLPPSGVTSTSASLAFAWPVAPDGQIMPRLEDLARDVAYIGHSTSLTRCRFLRGSAKDLPLAAIPAKRQIYRGRLVELINAYRVNPERPAIRPGASVNLRKVAASPSSEVPDPSWLVLRITAGPPLDIRAAAPICRLLRDALMSGYRRTGNGGHIPELVSGHSADQRPSRKPHLAIVPMAFVGTPHATGRIYGFALIPPAGTALDDLPGLQAAFRGVARYEAASERRVLTLRGGPLDSPIELAPAGGDRAGSPRSLSPRLYCAPHRLWATVTPIVLDRHLKQGTDAEIRALVAQACKNSGLPVPDSARIRTGRHAAHPGAPPARPHRGAPQWSHWRIPQSLASRPLVHAVIDFENEIAGPVLLGAGRFTGLGLCRGLWR